MRVCVSRTLPRWAARWGGMGRTTAGIAVSEGWVIQGRARSASRSPSPNSHSPSEQAQLPDSTLPEQAERDSAG
jgi:hypothetical protein